MRIGLPCGRDRLEISLPDDRDRVSVLEAEHLPRLENPSQALARGLAEPLAGPPLAELAQGRGDAVVVVSDITRPAPNRAILPPLLEVLERAGLARERITILVATGMHRPNTREELRSMLGPEVAEGYRVANHDCGDRAGLERVARLDGADIEINSTYVRAGLKILTGLIEPHPFAGFSGGGKSILPGLASFETMKFMHSFAMVDHPGVANARTEGNPFAEYVVQAAQASGADFLVNVTLDKAKEISGVFCGELIPAHRAGCAAAAKSAVARVGQPADLALTTGGGFPLDATLYQSSKGLAAVAEAIRPGGTIIWVSGCQEGLGGQEFQDLVGSVSGPGDFRRVYSRPENFVIDQWGAQVFFQVLEKAGQILLFCPNLSQEQIAPFGLTKIDDLQAALDRHLERGDRICLNPQGPYLVGLAGE